MINFRNRNYKIINRPRPGKKLLVLDLDQTLCDRIIRQNVFSVLRRPYLHFFLEEVYLNYDIIIWSATNLMSITHKLNFLGVLTHERYKIMSYFCEEAMTLVRINDTLTIRTKNLQTIWQTFPQFNKKNTILIDDLKKNFYCNKRNGLLIKSFRSREFNRDIELLLLMRYLRNLSNCENFAQVSHHRWKRQV